MNNTNWLISVIGCVLLISQIFMHLEVLNKLDNMDTISDYEFLQELDKRYMETNPYVLDEHDCVHISENLHLIHEQVGLSDYVIRSLSNVTERGHRRLCLEYEQQTQQLAGYADE